MKLQNCILISLCLFFIITPSYGFAKTSAYFVGPQGRIAKLDTDTNALIQLSLKTPANTTLDKILGADTINNYLYVTHCPRLGPCKVGVYGLKTLNFIKELPLVAQAPDVQMLIYPDGTKFLIQYVTQGGAGEETGYTTDLYDAKTLTKIKNLQTIFGMEKVMFPSDSKKIYSVIGGDDAHVDIIDSSSYQKMESRDLTLLWRKEPEVFSSGIESYGSGGILVFENVKVGPDLPDKLDLYVYDIEIKTTSTRISTGLQGDAIIAINGTKIIFDETVDVIRKFGGKDRVMGSRSLGRVHIYDVATGKELGLISFQAQGKGRIRGIRPAGDRLYYQSEGDTKETSKITVIDINNYATVTTVPLPFRVLFTTFFVE